MVLRLQLANGEVREYDTYVSRGSTESTPEYWETKCGRKKYEMPQSYDGCDHLDCALDAVGAPSFGGAIFFTAFCSFCISFFVLRLVPYNYIFYIFIFSVIFIPMGLVVGSIWNYDSKIRKELIEFRDHGTINGVAAEVKRTY